MAAKKKAKAKKKGPDLSNRVLKMGDLSKKEQSDAVAMESTVSETMPERMQVMAESHLKSPKPNMKAKGKRYAEAAPQMESKPLSMEDMVANRKEAFHNVTAGDLRMPGESVGGQEFYFKNRGEIDKTTGGSPIPINRIINATSRLSVMTKPENEKAALSALTQAHATGSVNFTNDLVAPLRSKKVKVPEELHGKETPFKEVPGPVVRGLTDPTIRTSVKRNVTDVNVDDMAKTSIRNNLKYAHEALQGVRGVSPTKNPKLFSYGEAHENAIPDSPEHREYQLRTWHIGAAKRGEVAGSQGMFDFEGLRSSNEGALSNEFQTPNDSWMLANQRKQPKAVRKVAGDVHIPTKEMKTKRGRKLAVGVGNADITKQGIQHAVGNEATIRTAKDTQKELGLDFTVPSMLIQEGVWAGERREAGVDTPFNNYKEQLKQNAKPKRDKNAPKPIKEYPTKSMPGLNWDQFKS